MSLIIVIAPCMYSVPSLLVKRFCVISALFHFTAKLILIALCIFVFVSFCPLPLEFWVEHRQLLFHYFSATAITLLLSLQSYSSLIAKLSKTYWGPSVNGERTGVQKTISAEKMNKNTGLCGWFQQNAYTGGFRLLKRKIAKITTSKNINYQKLRRTEIELL